MQRTSTIPSPDEPGDVSGNLTQRAAVVSAEATLQHIENLHARVQKLEALRIEAEGQLAHRVGNAYQAGELTRDDLVGIHQRYQALGIAGRATRWNAAVPVAWGTLNYEARVGKKHAPNGPEGSWVGSWPFSKEDRFPAPGTSVVYVLFNAMNEPIYVGSSGALRTRLKCHARDGKPFVAWQACRSESREAAYLLEDRLLKQRKPPMNKKAGR